MHTPLLTRSSLHRCLQRHGISRLPDVEGDKLKRSKFKAYPIGYFHIDIAQVSTEQRKLSLFVAIDRTSKFTVVQWHEKATQRIAAAFLHDLVAAIPYMILTVLTGNGIQLTDNKPVDEEAEAKAVAYWATQDGPRLYRWHSFEWTCEQTKIEHRVTKPRCPWTNPQTASDLRRCRSHHALRGLARTGFGDITPMTAPNKTAGPSASAPGPTPSATPHDQPKSSSEALRLRNRRQHHQAHSTQTARLDELIASPQPERSQSARKGNGYPLVTMQNPYERGIVTRYGRGMRAPATFIDLVRAISSGSAAHSLDDLDRHLTGELRSDGQSAAAVRHLETLGYKLDASGRSGDAARAYDLAALLDPLNGKRWHAYAFRARLRELIEGEHWNEAGKLIAELSAEVKAENIVRYSIDMLLGFAWDRECKFAVEAAVQCYRLAFELNCSDGSVATTDGCSLSAKIRNLRVLQMTALAEAGRHEEAAALHEQTRHIYGLGSLRIYAITSAKHAASDGNGFYRELLSTRRISEPEVTFFDGPVTLTSQCGTLDAPPQYVACFENCLTFPRSNIIVQNERLIYDLAAHPDRRVAEIKDGVNPDQIMLAIFGEYRALIEEPGETQFIDAGLMMFGFQSKNYGHWLLEFAPRMLWFNDRACPAEFPICIDDHMPDTHRQIIELLDERSRPIIHVSAKPTRFRQLAIAPVPTFFPFDCRPDFPVYDTVWPRDVLAAMRRNVLDRLGITRKKTRSTGRKIVLSRRGFVQRQLLNEAEIISVLMKEGFEVVNPENISFAEQVKIYHSADVIVGSASSALTNCIFCHSDAKVIGLIHGNRSFNFRGYTSMINASGAAIIFLRGKSFIDEDVHPFHSSFEIDPAHVLRCLM